jgi:hypothetical protein
MEHIKEYQEFVKNEYETFVLFYDNSKEDFEKLINFNSLIEFLHGTRIESGLLVGKTGKVDWDRLSWHWKPKYDAWRGEFKGGINEFMVTNYHRYRAPFSGLSGRYDYEITGCFINSNGVIQKFLLPEDHDAWDEPDQEGKEYFQTIASLFYIDDPQKILLSIEQAGLNKKKSLAILRKNRPEIWHKLAEVDKTTEVSSDLGDLGF